MTRPFDFARRALSAGCLLALATLPFVATPAAAADPLTVGVLLPGSRSDKGWMESAYDGIVAGGREGRTATRSRCR